MISWKGAIEEALLSKSAILVGLPDTGKTTLFRNIAEAARAEGVRVGLVDGDIGQKTIGPPCAVGLGLESFDAAAIHFVGDTTPATRPTEAVIGAFRMAREARRRGCRPIVVDTSGLAAGELGARLKAAKAELLKPDVAIVLERRGELSDLADLFASGGIKVLRVTAPAEVRPVSPEERAANRRQRFAAYFSEASPRGIALKGIAIQGGLAGGDFPEGLLVDLLDDSWATLAMGIVLKATDFSVEVLAPPFDAGAVRLIRPGVLRVSPRGEELGRI